VGTAAAPLSQAVKANENRAACAVALPLPPLLLMPGPPALSSAAARAVEFAGAEGGYRTLTCQVRVLVESAGGGWLPAEGWEGKPEGVG
jgi:hypothetical protein